MGSEIGIRGYVVRGKGTCCAEHEWAAVHQEVIEGTPDRAEATEFSTPREAFAVATRFEEARIFAVAEDGTKTPLPSYEEALAEIERLRMTERPEEKTLREAVAAMRANIPQDEREGIPGFADVCAALDALHRALWGPSGRLAGHAAKGGS